MDFSGVKSKTKNLNPRWLSFSHDRSAEGQLETPSVYSVGDGLRKLSAESTHELYKSCKSRFFCSLLS